MKVENLQKIIADHALWLKGEGGSRANLQDANLQDANLQDANLQDADLRGANLRGANLRGANLRWANLQYANLQDANLQDADLRWANLQYANLQDANLRGANLRWANLPDFQICPDEGDFIAWKKLCLDVVTKLLIPKEAKRTSSLVGRKCRAAFVIPIKMYSKDGQPVTSAPSQKDSHLVYECDKPFYADSYDADIRVECTHGIHFFMTRKEAENW